MKKILVLISFVLVSGALTASDVPEEFKARAKGKLPLEDKPYAYTVLLQTFEDVLLPRTRINFCKFIPILFADDFSQPPHTNAVIVSGWQCMYGKMAYALTFSDAEQSNSYQQAALFQTLALHKKAITQFNPTLGAEIEGFGCENCKNKAKAELGITHEGYPKGKLNLGKKD